MQHSSVSRFTAVVLWVAIGGPTAWAQLPSAPPPPRIDAAGNPGRSVPAQATPPAKVPASPGTADRRACEATRTMTSGIAARVATTAREATPPSPAPAAAGERQEPRVECIVIDEDGNRIEELRVRGQTQRLVVHPKDGGVPYEIQLLDAGRDPSAKSGPGRGGAGQRVWPVLSF